MSQIVTVDVADRPRGGALAAHLRLALAHRQPPPGCLGLVPCLTRRFSDVPHPRTTSRRVALIGAWEDADAAERAAREGVVADLARGARESWHVRGELARAVVKDPWGGWMPDAGDADPPAEDEPLLVLISGELRPRHLRAFWRDSAAAVRHAKRQPGYLGGLGLASSPFNTTSCSAWRTAADSRAYAFKPGAHAEALRRDRANGHHRTERFLRIRPLRSQGTLDGRDPFAGVLDGRPALAA